MKTYLATSTNLKYILIAFGVAGAMLLLGLLLRSKFKVFQKLFLPASVIGGFIGLILGPEILGLIPGISNLWISGAEATKYTTVESIYKIMDAIPGILIIPIFAATPLGLFKKKDPIEANADPKKKKFMPSVATGIFFLLMVVMIVQIIVGLGVNLATKAVDSSMDLYNSFGFELAIGFVGGHGTVGSIPALFGSILGEETTSISQGVGTVFATVGLIGGMLLGIIFINIAARKGKTAIMKEPVKLEGVQLTGIVKDINEQGSLGRETTKNFTVESLSIHLGIIIADCVLAYGSIALLKLVPKVGSILGQIPVWSLAMLYMFLINKLLQCFKLEWLIDRKVVARISGCMTDFAIVCAIAAMPLKAVASYIVPILIACLIGFVVTYILIFVFNKLLCKGDEAFEHSIIAWGTCTGVMMTGLMLLKICDPNYETKALSSFSKGFAVMSVVQVITLVIYQSFLGKSTLMLLVLSLILVAVFAVGLVISVLLRNIKSKTKA